MNAFCVKFISTIFTHTFNKMNTPNVIEDLGKFRYSFAGGNFTYEYVQKE